MFSRLAPRLRGIPKRALTSDEESGSADDVERLSNSFGSSGVDPCVRQPGQSLRNEEGSAGTSGTGGTTTNDRLGISLVRVTAVHVDIGNRTLINVVLFPMLTKFEQETGETMVTILDAMVQISILRDPIAHRMAAEQEVSKLPKMDSNDKVIPTADHMDPVDVTVLSSFRNQTGNSQQELSRYGVTAADHRNSASGYSVTAADRRDRASGYDVTPEDRRFHAVTESPLSPAESGDHLMWDAQQCFDNQRAGISPRKLTNVLRYNSDEGTFIF
ncbi:hypothetical protein DPMN_153811 [Dreissena polymorpha]|uniref:Uncharacterized protein n=1 Tax=Dreissena polymorpha TaxID=45954 RepID=A0A9D4J9R2_DREPO|nr:hypothetical protein DPMN_153811 [Dreissena polymorpha]